MSRNTLVATHVGRAGVYAVARLVESRGHAFREHFTHDLGIDAHIELFDVYGRPRGRFLALQIKSGRSFFRRCSGSAVEYYFDDRLHDYWQQHLMPIVLVLHNPEDGRILWQHISPETVIRSSGRWRVDLPFANDFVNLPFTRLEAIAETSFDVLGSIQRPSKSNRLHVYRMIPNNRRAIYGYPVCATNDDQSLLLTLSTEYLSFNSKMLAADDEWFNAEYERTELSLEFDADAMCSIVRAAFFESTFEVQTEPQRNGAEFELYLGNDKYMTINAEVGNVSIDGIEEERSLAQPFARNLHMRLNTLFAPALNFIQSDAYAEFDVSVDS